MAILRESIQVNYIICIWIFTGAYFRIAFNRDLIRTHLSTCSTQLCTQVLYFVLCAYIPKLLYKPVGRYLSKNLQSRVYSTRVLDALHTPSAHIYRPSSKQVEYNRWLDRYLIYDSNLLYCSLPRPGEPPLSAPAPLFAFIWRPLASCEYRTSQI